MENKKALPDLEEIKKIELFLYDLIMPTITRVFEYLDEKIEIVTALITTFENSAVLTYDDKIEVVEYHYENIGEFITTKCRVENEDLLFCGEKIPRSYGESYIGIIIKSRTVEKYIKLYKNNATIYRDINTSLIHSVADEILKVCKTFLITVEAENYKTISPLSDAVDMVRRGAKKFISTLAGTGKNGNEIFGLYELCEEISMLKYESVDAVGGFIIADTQTENVEMLLTLKDPITIEKGNYRKIRKLVQLTDDKTYLYTDAYKIYGVGRIKESYDIKEESIFVVKIIKHHFWEVMHLEDKLMEVVNGYPKLPMEDFSEYKFRADFKRNFQDDDKINCDYILKFIKEAVKQNKGTMILITEKAGEESTRLETQSFLVKKEVLDLGMVKKITSIDGAIILSPEGVCYGIGTILDGIATNKGDISRGARYNSAVRYFEAYKDRYNRMLVVISEDGMIDIIAK